MVRDKCKLPKKRFGEKYSIQQGPEHSGSDEGIHILLQTFRQSFSMFCNITATFPHDREIPELSAFFRVAFGYF